MKDQSIPILDPPGVAGDPEGVTADSAKVLRFPHEPQTLGRKLEHPKRAA